MGRVRSPGAGTGTARTGHDPAVAATPGAAGGRRGEDETGWPDAGAAGAGPSTGVRLARNAGPRPGDEGADHSADRPADQAGDGEAAAGWSGARRTDTAPDSESVAGIRRSGSADGSGSTAGHRQPGSADSSGSAAGQRQSGGSGRAGTRQSSAASVGSGTAPDSPPRHDHPDTAPDSPSTASAGAGPAGLREWDTNSPAAPPSYGSLDLSPGARDNAHPDARPDTHPGIHPDDDADTEPVPTTASRGHHPSPDSSDSTAERARSLLIPVSDPEPRAPAAPAVAPVLPGRPVANRPQVRAPGPEFGPQGGTPCPWCATLNLPDRHYCGRCAMPMAGGGPSAPGRQPWWRRIPGFGVAQTPWAGDRPGCAAASGPS